MLATPTAFWRFYLYVVCCVYASVRSSGGSTTITNDAAPGGRAVLEQNLL